MFELTFAYYRVYCKYHYLEGHESDNAEEEIWSFLVRLSHNDIDITKKQYIDEDDDRPFSLDSKISSIKKSQFFFKQCFG